MRRLQSLGLVLCVVGALIGGPARAADDPGLRYRSGRTVALAGYVGAGVGVGLVTAATLLDSNADPGARTLLEAGGTLTISSSMWALGAGSFSAADAVNSAGCPTTVAPAVTAYVVGFLAATPETLVLLAASVDRPLPPFLEQAAGASRWISLGATGVRMALGSVQLALDARGARRCGLTGPARTGPTARLAPWTAGGRVGLLWTVTPGSPRRPP